MTAAIRTGTPSATTADCRRNQAPNYHTLLPQLRLRTTASSTSPPPPTPALASPPATVKPDQPEEVNRTQVPAGENLPGEYETILAEAVKLQHEADSVMQATGDTARAASCRQKPTDSS
ncbi:MAG: hypothetical protein MZV63_69635 [Marinilabiliales bacterium]|nr:hypothetical protein [Marinilabiliales bacterium]